VTANRYLDKFVGINNDIYTIYCQRGMSILLTSSITSVISSVKICYDIDD